MMVETAHSLVPIMPLRPTSCRLALLALLALCALAGAVAAQEPAVALRGAVVTAESGDFVPYAVVVLEPRFSQRFTDQAGSFAFLGVTPGTYRLQVRQVGFLPFDSTITVAAAPPPLRIALVRIAVELRGITVAARTRCLPPGRLDAAATPALVTIVEQLRLNAQRQALLLDRYPFQYHVVRELTDVLRGGFEHTRTDTLLLRSNTRWSYAPGRVVTESAELQGTGTRDVHLPVLADFADSSFQAWHCFSLGGMQVVEGRELVRLDFRASPELREPDVNGTAYLDPVSYQVVRTRVELTRLEQAAAGVTSWTATVTFREIMPNLTTADRLSAVTRLVPRNVPSTVVERRETQQLLRFSFLRAPPVADSPP